MLLMGGVISWTLDKQENYSPLGPGLHDVIIDIDLKVTTLEACLEILKGEGVSVIDTVQIDKIGFIMCNGEDKQFQLISNVKGVNSITLEGSAKIM